MKKIRLSLLGLSLLSISGLFAQTPKASLNKANMRQGESVEYCTHDKHMAEAMKDPLFAAQFNATQAALAQEELAKGNGSNKGSEKATLLTIPVVFHVLHNGGPENISREQVLDVLAILNRDFRKLNADAATVHPDFQGMPADVEIEFALATKAPNGQCFSGITRTQSPLTSDGSDGSAQVSAIVNGNDVFNGQWPPNRYMNVYIAADIGGAAGYTFNPAGGSSMYFNGIFLLHNYTGSIGTSSVFNSRTLTHEVGHWLNLSHTWGGNNDPGVACGSDGVADTPQTRGVTSCDLNENFCGPRANVENYMDYSYCSKMFTPGQVTRMRTAANSSTAGRNNLWTASNLTFTGADAPLALCQAQFSAPKTTVCAGETLQFTDESYNAATGWTWTFDGGTPASSTAQNPSVTYNTPGVYTVTLVATDGASSDGETRTSYITVLPTAEGLPFYEGFESLSDFNNSSRWIVENGGGNAWTVSTATGNTGTRSATLTNFGQTANQLDELQSGSIDLSSITAANGVTLSFRYAYRKRQTSNTDVLRVFLSKDCGDVWDVRKTMTATSMTAGQTATSSWTPAPSDFITVHMTNVTSAFWVEDFRFKFTFTNGGGNNIFLDDINIYAGAPSDAPVTVGIEEGQVINNAMVYPNPAEGELNVRFSANAGQNITVVITDLAGKAIQQHYVKTNEGDNLVLVSTEGLSAGMYMVQLAEGNTIQTLPFMVK